MRNVKMLVAALAVLGMALQGSVAQSLTAKQQLDARMKVETAVALAAIAEAEGNGEAMLVAAQMLSAVGSVAKKTEPGAEQQFYSVREMADGAKRMGADATRADALMSTAEDARGYCYWDYECGTFECGWLYICT